MNLQNLKHQTLYLMMFVASISLMDTSNAQSTRSLDGQISLDVAPAIKDLKIDISVRNHAFVVIPPTFLIIRPIQSMVTTQVMIAKGESSANYGLSGIIENPVDYTVQIRCPGCEDIIPTQYYRPEGNAFGLINSTYIDPVDLPAQLDLTAKTRASISGAVVLQNPASRDLDFTFEIASSADPSFIVSDDNRLTINKGEQNANYQITGLARSSDSFLLSLKCNSCLGNARKKRIFESALSSQANHTGIDFIVISEGIPIIVPAISLLMEDPD